MGLHGIGVISGEVISSLLCPFLNAVMDVSSLLVQAYS